MQESIMEFLVEPGTDKRLNLVHAEHDKFGTVVSGALVTESGNSYPIRNGIPRFVPVSEQQQTAESFGYKWKNQGAYEHEHYLRFIERDEIPRWGLSSVEQFYDIFRNRQCMLDVGCGSAHFASIYVPKSVKGATWVATDLSLAIDIAQRRLGHIKGTNFVQGNLLDLPYADETFDFILARGVLHHTPSTYDAFKSCVRVLQRGGEFMFLIYRKMGPVREFTDAYVRDKLSRLSPEVAWKDLAALTKFGCALAELNVEVDVPEDIPVLEIPAGKYNLQRLIYYHFLKAYWNPDLGFETNQHNTFDWYHPQYSFHHTEDEVRSWCASHGLDIHFIKPMETSWAVRAVKTNRE